MSRYNLIDEKWIPVRDLQGNRTELGILETLLLADKLAAIEDPSPLVTASIYRFLLAVLYRALEGPCDIDEAKELFEKGLPEEKIRNYLEKWRDRFWLFDEKYPFGQIPKFVPKTWRSWTTLAAEHNADTAKVLFDHIDINASGSIALSKAICWLLATQSFSVSTGKSEIAHTGTAPSAGLLMAIPVGRTLLDTLLFCLVPQNREVMKTDLPIWEREPEHLSYLQRRTSVREIKTGEEKNRAVERVATGISDLFTWRSRAIILKPDGKDVVSELGLASGVGYVESQLIDPMLGFVEKKSNDDESKEITRKRFPLHFEERGVWRDFDTLLPDETDLAPKVIVNAVSLTKRNSDRIPKGLLVLGQRYYPPRPNITFWRKEFFVFPGLMSKNKYIREDIRTYLEEAETAGRTLNSACTMFGKMMLVHSDRKGDRKPENSDIKNFVEQIQSISYYWSMLEAAFHETLNNYTLGQDFDDIHHDWLLSVRNTLSDSWELLQTSITGGDGWSIRAFVNATNIIDKKVIALNKKIQSLKEI